MVTLADAKINAFIADELIDVANERLGHRHPVRTESNLFELYDSHDLLLFPSHTIVTASSCSKPCAMECQWCVLISEARRKL